MQKLKETGGSRYINRNELDKPCFKHDIANGDFKYLPRETTSEKLLLNKEFKIASDLKCGGSQ